MLAAVTAEGQTITLSACGIDAEETLNKIHRAYTDYIGGVNKGNWGR